MPMEHVLVNAADVTQLIDVSYLFFYLLYFNLTAYKA